MESRNGATSDFEFYVGRMLQERQAAALAADQIAKRMHLQLAAFYLEKAQACAESQRVGSGSGGLPHGLPPA